MDSVDLHQPRGYFGKLATLTQISSDLHQLLPQLGATLCIFRETASDLHNPTLIGKTATETKSR